MKILLIIIGLIFSLNVFAQNIAKNNVFAELSGATGVYSINYERLLGNKETVYFSFRAGLAYFPTKVITNTNVGLYYNSRIIIPLSFSLLKNLGGNNYLEIRVSLANGFYTYENWKVYGLGDTTGTFKPETKIGYDFIPGIGIGYRYFPKSDGIFFNVLLQRISYFSKENWYGNLSLGIGYAF